MSGKRAVRNSHQGHRYYTNTSSALEYGAIHAYTMGKRHKGYDRIYRTRPRIRARKKPVTVYKDVGQTHAKISALAVVTIALIFICALGVALSYAALYGKSLHIAQLNSDLKQKREQNAVLEAEIAKSYDLKEIERIATTKLNMAKPTASQIIPISVPKQSYRVPVEDVEPESQGETAFQMIKRFFNKKE